MLKKKLLTVKDCENLSLHEIKGFYKDHVNPAIHDILDTFSFGQEIITEAQGVWLKTRSGRKILDVSGGAGVLNLGHNPENILKSRIEFQEAKRMEVHKSFFSPYTAALSHNLAQVMPGELNYSFFCNSGAEAVEGALKLAYKYHEGKRDIVLYSDIAFHGKLIASGSLASSKHGFEFQSTLGRDAFLYNDIASFKNKVQEHRGKIYAVIVEPFSATHLRMLSGDFLQEMRKICDENGIVLIFDEVYTGWFKTGPLLSFMTTEVVPDIVTLSKTLGGGKSSISAYVSQGRVLKKAYGKVKNALLHSSTYNGFAEECVTAIESINTLFSSDMEARSFHIGEKFLGHVEELKKKHGKMQVGGRGALNGIFLDHEGIVWGTLMKLLPVDMVMGEHFLEKLLVASVIDRLFEKHGIHALFMTSGKPALLFSPSLIIQDEEIDLFFKALDDVLSEGRSHLLTRFIKKKFQG